MNACVLFLVTLQVLYKLKTAKLFDATKCRPADAGDNLLAVNMMFFCVESRLLCVAGAEHVLLFKFSKQENMVDCPVCLNVSWFLGLPFVKRFALYYGTIVCLSSPNPWPMSLLAKWLDGSRCCLVGR